MTYLRFFRKNLSIMFASACFIVPALFFVSGCQIIDTEPVDGAYSEGDLPPVEEQMIIDQRIRYCYKRFDLTRKDYRLACITGYLAQPIQTPSP